MPDFYTEFHTLNGASLQGHLVSILCHGVFERHPAAQLILMEGGLVGYVGVLWRLDQNWRSTRSEIPWCRRRPSEYVWDHVHFTTQPLEEPDDALSWRTRCARCIPSARCSTRPTIRTGTSTTPIRRCARSPPSGASAIRFRTAAELFGVPVPAAA